MELLVVVAITGVVAKYAIPGMRHMVQRSAISANVNTFMANVRLARAEAIKRGGRVVMCRSSNPESSSPSCGTGSTGWTSGWVVFYDTNNNSAWDSGEKILLVQSPITEIDAIQETGTGSTKLNFTSTGRLSNLSTATTLKFGGNNFLTNEQRTVCVSLGGYVRVAGDGGAACA